MSDIVMASGRLSAKAAIARDRTPGARVAAGLHLAAAPTFALMALLTALGGSQSNMLCAAMPHASPLGGMVPMYILMSVFHAAPWLKLIRGRPAADQM
jgi:hypothetical protein